MPEAVTTAAPNASTSNGQAPVASKGGKDAGAAAVAPKPPEPKPEVRRHKLKVDKGEVELDEDQLKLYAQKGFASEKRFSEAAQMRKDLEEIKELSAKDRRGALKKLGWSDQEIRDFAESALYQDLEQEKLSPEQRRIRELEAREKEREETDRKSKAEAEEKELQELTKQKLDDIGGRIMAALEKVGLPKESAPWAVKRMAALVARADAEGFDLSAEQLASVVRGEFDAEARAFTASMPPEQLAEWLGPEKVDALMRLKIQQLKAQKAGAQPAPKAAPEQKPSPVQPAAKAKDPWDNIFAIAEGRAR